MNTAVSALRKGQTVIVDEDYQLVVRTHADDSTTNVEYGNGTIRPYSNEDTVEVVECLQKGPECKGLVEYRMPLSGTGRSFPRCEHHWDERLDLEQGLRERYPEQPPADWSPLDAGESWDEEDY